MVPSSAIILYELLLRSRAYEGLYLSTEEIAKNAGSGTLRPEIPAPWPAEARELLIKAWHHDPNVRPEFSTIAPELGKWRNDTDCRVLKGLAKGSKRGIFERIGYEKNAIVASYGMKKRGRQGSVLGRSGSFSGIGRRSLGAGSSSGNGKRSRPHDQEKRLTQ